MTRKREDIHRRAVIKPEDYEYAGLVRVFQGEVKHESDEGTAQKLRASSAAGLRAYGEDEIGRCDHCGAHLKNISVWRHVPTGGYIAIGETCAKETMQVPDRMVLDIKRLADWRAGVERPHTPEEWKQYRLKEARHTYPETLAFLYAVLDGSVGEKHVWWADATGNDQFFLAKLARGFEESGRVSERLDAVVKRTRDTTIAEKIKHEQRMAVGAKHAPTGRRLTLSGVVKEIIELYNGYTTRPAMIVEGDGHWTMECTIPKSLVEGGWPTVYKVKEGDHVRFVADVDSSPDPYIGWAKRPKQVEVLSEEEVEKIRAAEAEAARIKVEAESEAQAVLRDTPPEEPPPRSPHREGSMDDLREKARRLGIDYADLLRAEARASQ